MSMGDVWQDLAKYEYGDKTDAGNKAHLLLQDTPVAEHAKIETILIGIVSSKDSTQTGKALACRSLQQIGTEKCVPAVSALLCDKILSHAARLVLEVSESPKASAALLAALPKADENLKAGIIMSLGTRKETTAIKAIAASLGSKDAGTAAAAMRSLAKIGGKQASACLAGATAPAALMPVLRESQIVCAESLDKADAAKICSAIYADTKNSNPVRIAALRGLMKANGKTAAPMVVELLKGKPGYMKSSALRIVASDQCKCLTGAVAAALGKLPEPCQIKVLDVLGQRGDAGAMTAIAALYASESSDLKMAAYTAAGRIGDAACVIPLLTLANDKDHGVSQKAVEIFGIIVTDGVDKILASKISDPKLGPGAISALTRRGCTSAAGEIIKMIENGDTKAKQAGWQAMSQLASDQDLAALMKMVVKITDDGIRKEAANAIKNICTNSSDRRKCFDAIGASYDQADKNMKTLILQIGATTGGVKALATAQKALKSSDEDIRTAAMRALMEWQDSGAADILLDIAKNGKTAKDKILAVRGYIQVTGKDDERKRADMYKKIAPLATRADEKNLIISGLRNIRRSNVNVLNTVAAYIADDSVKATAEQATIDVANRIKRDKKCKDAILKLMKSIKETSKNKSNVSKAGRLYKELGGK
jgi:HEAT repeat protein